MEKVLEISGMNCGHCAASVEKALRAVPGVTNATVDLETKTAKVIGAASDDALKAAVADAGFEVVSFS